MMNVFRILADVSHTTSKCILIWAIHSNKSAEGVSLITQSLYILVFFTRYIDLFYTPPSASWWNFLLKNFYILSSLYIIYLMTRRFARTREKEKAWQLTIYILIASAISSPVVSAIYEVGLLKHSYRFTEVLWTFSIILESVCVIPQLLLLRQTTVPTVIDSFYLVALGSYRALYILNWIYRTAKNDRPNGVSVLFGIIQTALYIDFAWVYWTRQRVKLRGGAIVDGDDLSKGFLVNRFAQLPGNQSSEDLHDADGGEEERGRPGMNKWGARGVSVRADDTLEEHDRAGHHLVDPDEFEDDEDDDAPVLDTKGMPRL